MDTALTAIAELELEQLQVALSAAKSLSEAQLLLYRATVATQATANPLAQFLQQLANQHPVASTDIERRWLALWKPWWQLQEIQTVFATELEQRLALLKRAPNPEVLRLELHRLRVAARAAKDPLEQELQLLESGQQHSVTDARLQAALPQSRVTPAQTVVPAAQRSMEVSIDATSRVAVSQESVRVPVVRLDALLAQAGELTVGRIRIEERLYDLRELLSRRNIERRNNRHARVMRRRLQNLAEENRDVAALLGYLETNEDSTRRALDKLESVLHLLATDISQLRTVNTIIEDEVLSVRLLPAAMLFPPLERLVRDLGQQLGKQVQLQTFGGNIGIDRKILEGLRDPLMHMIRNALDHGLEQPEIRQAQQKPAVGQIHLSVRTSGGMVTLTLEDDGAGMDVQRILRKAEEKGIIPSAATYDPKLALDLIFEPGFSTAAAVTDVSGRGVGMDVVRQNLRALSGTVAIQSELGVGSQFTLRVPAQLATVRVLLVRIGRDTFAIPTASLERTGRVKIEGIQQLEGRSAIILENRAIPLVELGAILEVPFEAEDAWQPYFVLRREEERLACTVDAMLGEQEVVVKKLSYPLEQFAPLEGAAILGSGQLVSILSSNHLLERGLRREIRVRRELKLAPIVAARVPRIMVVDDSITSRTLERSILEAAGFETITAVHGAQALDFLRRGEQVDLVVSDVEMPELDGFGLTTEIRRDPRLAQIPVILITSLNAPEHKERGALAGADAYIVKGEFDQGVLLETINRLL